jgi:hypothetical protein
MPIEHEETVISTEDIVERARSLNPFKFTKIPELNSKVTAKITKDFTCPACHQLLQNAISTNGKVSGWCGNSHEYVSVSVKQ